MSDNLKEVLMAVIALISAVVTPLIVLYVSQKQMKKIHSVECKVEDNHKLINGHMTALLEATKQLATIQEKARADAEKTHKKH